MLEGTVREVINTLEEFKAENVCCFDASKKSSLFDYIVIVTGKNSTHTKALAKHLRKEMKRFGVKNKKISSEQSGDWIALDLGSILLHIMIQEIRELYRLEELWCDANDANKVDTNL